MYRYLSKLKGCNCLLISVQGLIVQTTLTNKTTADYINYNFWGLSVKARKYLREMDCNDDLTCIRMTTSYYECIITIGGVVDESDFMIFFTQTMPHSSKRPLTNLERLGMTIPVPTSRSDEAEEKDPILSMKKALTEMSERPPDCGLSMYELKKMAFLSKAIETPLPKRPSVMSQRFDAKRSTLVADSSQMIVPDDSLIAMSLRGSKQRMSQMSVMSSLCETASVTTGKSGPKYSAVDGSKTGSKQLLFSNDKKNKQLRKEKYDWIKIDRDDPMHPPEEAPLYRVISSSSDQEDDDIGYWRKRQDRTFPIFDADGTVLQDEVSIGFKPCSGKQFPPRKCVNKKVKKEMVFKRRPTVTQGNAKPDKQ